MRENEIVLVIINENLLLFILFIFLLPLLCLSVFLISLSNLKHGPDFSLGQPLVDNPLEQRAELAVVKLPPG